MLIDFEKHIKIPTPLQEIREKLFESKGVRVFVKRDDLCHPDISGNKFRKLKYTLEFAKSQGKTALLTFGGAYSNHIRAVAEAGRLFDFETRAFIRGEELHEDSNSCLAYAHQRGMKLMFIDREAYRDKENLAKDYLHTHFIIPEGGSMPTALPGLAELVDEDEIVINSNYICTAVGTGGTMAGLLSNKDYQGKVLGFAVLKDGGFLENDISELLDNKAIKKHINLDFHFGGYAKYTPELIEFCLDFEQKHNIPLEQVYTGKMVFGFYDLLQKDYFKPGSTIILLHTGGLQGRNF